MQECKILSSIIFKMLKMTFCIFAKNADIIKCAIFALLKMRII